MQTMCNVYEEACFIQNIYKLAKQSFSLQRAWI